MRLVRLLLPVRTVVDGDEAIIAPGAELVVDDAEARRLLGAIGLAEDLGPHIEIPGGASRSDAGEGPTHNPQPAPAAPTGEGATPSGPAPEGTDAPESGAPGSNQAPDGDGLAGDAGPGEAASKPASPAAADAPAKKGKRAK